MLVIRPAILMAFRDYIGILTASSKLSQFRFITLHTVAKYLDHQRRESERHRLSLASGSLLLFHNLDQLYS